MSPEAGLVCLQPWLIETERIAFKVIASPETVGARHHVVDVDAWCLIHSNVVP